MNKFFHRTGMSPRTERGQCVDRQIRTLGSETQGRPVSPTLGRDRKVFTTKISLGIEQDLCYFE